MFDTFKNHNNLCYLIDGINLILMDRTFSIDAIKNTKLDKNVIKLVKIVNYRDNSKYDII